MMIPRVYDEYNRLQCKSCKAFYSKSCYYQHNAPNGRFRNLDDHICKKCHRQSEVADTSRANARAKYATDPDHREKQIARAKARYWANKEAINTRKRAIWIAKKYGDEVNKRLGTRKTSSE